MNKNEGNMRDERLGTVSLFSLSRSSSLDVVCRIELQVATATESVLKSQLTPSSMVRRPRGLRKRGRARETRGTCSTRSGEGWSY